MSKLELIRKLYLYQVEMNAWLDSIPEEVRAVFYDNSYVEGLYKQAELLLEYTFTISELVGIEDYFLQCEDKDSAEEYFAALAETHGWK